MQNFILQKFYYERGLSFCSFISKFTQLKGWKLVLATLNGFLFVNFKSIICHEPLIAGRHQDQENTGQFQ